MISIHLNKDYILVLDNLIVTNFAMPLESNLVIRVRSIHKKSKFVSLIFLLHITKENFTGQVIKIIIFYAVTYNLYNFTTAMLLQQKFTS